MKAGGCVQTAVAITFSNGSEKTQFRIGGSTARAVARGGTEMEITRNELTDIYEGLRGIQEDLLETADILESMASTMRAYEKTIADITDLMEDDVNGTDASQL